MEQNNALRFMVAEDHKQYSLALCDILKMNFEGCTVETVFDGAELLAATEKKKYDTILVDIRMPKVNGLLATREIVSKDKDAKIIVVSFFDNPANMRHAFRLGAKGFVTKSDDIKNIINAIHSVLDGNFYGGGTEMIQQVLDQIIHKSDQEFTPRETDVIFSVAKGKSHKETADDLNISEHTVRSHMTSIHIKTNTNTLAELVAYCAKLGWN